MNPVYLNPLPSPFPLLEHNEDQHFQFFNPPSEASSSSLSSFVFFNPTQEQRGSYDIEQQQQADKYVLHCGSSDHHFLPSPSLPTVENDINNGLKFSICKREDTDDNQINSGQVKWMSSKMRWMKKMNSDIMGADKPGTVHMNQDHPQPPSPVDTDNSSNNSNSKITVRVCADCNTTKTPLWRSGPRGPKSLCNACGIRQRKARRAMAAAASGTLLATNTSSMKTKVHRKEKRSDNGYVQQYKKRCNLTTPRSRKKLCFEDFTLNLSKSLAFHQVFPQDEKDAAILLMALSCGLVHG